MASSITGEGGTIIDFAANSFLDPDGNIVTSEVQVNLNEYLTLSDMIKNNVQTLSNGQLLVTGGSFELLANDLNNTTLSVNPWSVSAQLPIKTDITGFESGMGLFTGDRIMIDGLEQVNWNLNQNTEFWLDASVMNFFGINFGLSNCDMLYDLASENPTQFSVYLETIPDPSNYIVWMFIKDFPSVISITSPTDDGAGVKTYDNSIPLGLTATLLVFGVDADNYLQLGTLDVNVLGDDIFTVALEYATTEMVKDAINAIGN